MSEKPNSIFNDRHIHWIIASICILGILLRLVYFFQNPNLIIDEANIARNLAARDFAGLLSPLHYEQYAPPVFLWILKAFAIVFGFSEMALRLFPLLCGMAAIFGFYKVLNSLLPVKSLWYPLAMLTLGTIYIKHSVEVKQYMPDVLITLSLILLALKTDIQKTDNRKFLLIWLVAGSVAVWSSMPSVFILAAIGAYYTSILLANKKWKSLWLIVFPALFWLVQFIIYYQLILKQQITSDYLQNYHQDYFLFALPSSQEEWMHNGKRLYALLGETGGYTALALVFNTVLICIGLVTLYKKNKHIFLLIVVPVALVLLAAALRQYSLIARLILFCLPLGLIIIGFGFEKLMRTQILLLKTGLILVALVCIENYSMWNVLFRKYGFHEITEGMSYLKQKNVSGSQLFIHHSSGDTYRYYTQLHPKKEKWNSLTGATILKWDSDYAVETDNVRDTVYLLYTGGFSHKEKSKRIAQIETSMRQVDYFEKYECVVYGYVPK